MEPSRGAIIARAIATLRTGDDPAAVHRMVDRATKSEAQEMADAARKVAATTAIVGALGLLIGAFIACVAAATGGRPSDSPTRQGAFASPKVLPAPAGCGRPAPRRQTSLELERQEAGESVRVEIQVRRAVAEFERALQGAQAEPLVIQGLHPHGRPSSANAAATAASRRHPAAGPRSPILGRCDRRARRTSLHWWRARAG